MTMTETIPKSEYEIQDGTPAVAHGTHEPRTLQHTRTEGDDVRVNLMSEIGDGIFVCWWDCAKCNLRIGTCACKDGPEEPEYITKWRDKRFGRSLNARPEVDFEALPDVVKYLKSQGLSVFTKEEIAEYAEAIRQIERTPKTEVTEEQVESFEASDDQNAREHKERTLYDVARQATDEVLGEGAYAEINAGNPDPGVQSAIARDD